MPIALFRGGYALASIPVLLVLGQVIGSGNEAGPILFRMEAELALFLSVILGHYFGSEIAGDSRSGVLDLVAISGISPGEWILFQLARIWTGFLTVWCVRFPVVAFLGTLGGASTGQWLHKELLLLLIFAVCSTLSLAVSHAADTRQKAWGKLLFQLFAVELLVMLPMLALSAWRTYLGSLPNLPGIKALQSLPPMGFVTATNSLFSVVSEPEELLPTAILYALVTLGNLLWLFPNVFTRFESADEVAGIPGVRQLVFGVNDRRPSRRSWDDALAWQAFAIHSAGMRGAIGKSIAYLAAAGLLVWIHQLGQREFAAVMAGAGACGALLHSANKPGDCINRELKGKTLSTLALTPLTPIEFYSGWRRGSWVLAIPDLAVFAALVSVLAFAFPPALPIVLTIGGVILALAPLLALSVVTSWTFAGVVTGLVTVFGLIVVILICVGVGGAISSWAAPVLGVPAAILYGWLIRRFALPSWMSRKIEEAL